MKTCYDSLSIADVCTKHECRNFVNCKRYKNCLNVAINENPQGMTLANIGEIIGVSRMRICQLQKDILQKLRGHVNARS